MTADSGTEMEETGHGTLAVPAIKPDHIAILDGKFLPLEERYGKARGELLGCLGDRLEAYIADGLLTVTRTTPIRRRKITQEILPSGSARSEGFWQERERLMQELFPDLCALPKMAKEAKMARRTLQRRCLDLYEHFFLQMESGSSGERHVVEVVPVTNEDNWLFGYSRKTVPFVRRLDESTTCSVISMQPYPLGAGEELRDVTEPYMGPVRDAAGAFAAKLAALYETLKRCGCEPVESDDVAREVAYVNRCLQLLLDRDFGPDTGLYASQLSARLRGMEGILEESCEKVDRVYDGFSGAMHQQLTLVRLGFHFVYKRGESAHVRLAGEAARTGTG